jgi:thiamine biosynthesis lipoprotein
MTSVEQPQVCRDLISKRIVAAVAPCTRRRPRPMKRAALGALAIGGCLVGVACQVPASAPSSHKFSGPTMGTRYNIEVVISDMSSQRLVELRGVVEEVLGDVNAKMSNYLPDSEISRLNLAPGNEPFAVSADLLEVLLHAREISETTGGAFDITVAPLVGAWGFGPAGRPIEQPTAEQIERLRELTGWQKLEIDRASSTVTKALDELTIDLSAIAKGFAVDRVANALDREGVPNYMVEVGGEVKTNGVNAQEDPWRIGIERPLPNEQAIDLIVPLSGLAMATSGDYRNYYEVDGRRLSHSIDPRTGSPITHNVASVSVIAPLCVRADAYATGLLVLGSDGYHLAEELGLAAYFLQRDKEGLFVGRMTTAFKQILESGNRDRS